MKRGKKRGDEGKRREGREEERRKREKRGEEEGETLVTELLSFLQEYSYPFHRMLVILVTESLSFYRI
jgi:hypothetical protein